jgi:predicted AlkP superfamily phosphohydrolase/phosphomutase
MAKQTGTSREKVFVLGLDGATFDILDPLVEMGIMPHLKLIIKEGARGELKSTIPPVSGPAWVSFMTGKYPEKHGIFDFIKNSPKQQKRKIISYKDIRGKTLWELLSRRGYQVGGMNVPVTYPPPKVNGFLISGMLSPDFGESLTYPPHLYHELKQHIPGYIIDVNWQEYSKKDIKSFLQDLIFCTSQRKQTLTYLLNNHAWDFFTGVFVGPDRLQHFLWQQVMATLWQKPANTDEQEIAELILKFYQQLDSVLALILRSLEHNTSLIIMSDHGFGPLTQKFYINRWLAKEGLLALKRGALFRSHQYSRFKRIVKQLILKMDGGVSNQILALRRHYKEGGWKDSSLACINWEKTIAYAASNSEQGIYLNLKGREPKGTVSQGEEYERLRTEIIQRLKAFRHPETGEGLGSQIYRREDIYQGEYAATAPDIVFLLNDYKWLADIQPLDCLFKPANLQTGTGTHRMNGILIAYGRGIKSNHCLSQSCIVDLAPTILSMLNLPVPSDMDGQVLTELFTQDFLEHHPVTYAVPEIIEEEHGGREIYSEQEARKIENRLRCLGYLD